MVASLESLARAETSTEYCTYIPRLEKSAQQSVSSGILGLLSHLAVSLCQWASFVFAMSVLIYHLPDFLSLRAKGLTASSNVRSSRSTRTYVCLPMDQVSGSIDLTPAKRLATIYVKRVCGIGFSLPTYLLYHCSRSLERLGSWMGPLGSIRVRECKKIWPYLGIVESMSPTGTPRWGLTQTESDIFPRLVASECGKMAVLPWFTHCNAGLAFSYSSTNKSEDELYKQDEYLCG